MNSGVAMFSACGSRRYASTLCTDRIVKSDFTNGEVREDAKVKDFRHMSEAWTNRAVHGDIEFAMLHGEMDCRI